MLIFMYYAFYTKSQFWNLELIDLHYVWDDIFSKDSMQSYNLNVYMVNGIMRGELESLKL